jgi:hypothetical protein
MKKGKLWANVMVLKCGANETPLRNIIDNMMGTQFFFKSNPQPTKEKPFKIGYHRFWPKLITFPKKVGNYWVLL